MNQPQDSDHQSYRLRMTIPAKTVKELGQFWVSLVQAINSIMPPTMVILNQARESLDFDLEELKALAAAEQVAIDQEFLIDRSWDERDLSIIINSIDGSARNVFDRIMRKTTNLLGENDLENRILILALLSGLESVRVLTGEFIPEDAEAEPAPEPDANDEERGHSRTVEEAIELVFGVVD